jgi:hypothetical protein
MPVMLTNGERKSLIIKGLPAFIPAKVGTGLAVNGGLVEGRPTVGQLLDRDAVLMALAGWSSARIARAYGVTQSAAWRYVARRRAGAKGYRPIWRWGQCSGCRCWGWFRLTPARKRRPPSNLAGRWFCSAGCYRARGTDPALALAALKRPRRGGKGKRRSWFVSIPASPQPTGRTNAGQPIP